MASCTEHGEWEPRFFACPKCFKDGDVSKPIWNAGELEYLSWFGYRPDGTCPQCGEEWTDVMFAYDGPHCPVRRILGDKSRHET